MGVKPRRTRFGLFKGHVRSEPVDIDAPIERVWDILTDFERYGEWNPFTPSVTTNFEIGSPVELYVRMGHWRLKQVERIEVVEPPHVIAWSTTMGHRFLISALREQRLEAVGEGRCRYRTWDDFSGLLIPLVMLLFGGFVRRGFNDVARGLKTRAETVSAD
ncbi:MAG: SRPBCC domain-containing protein [Gemmatimonadales bacterium]|nr:SRPBCC domain-containing protein [Gemmatimonadales bacterium]MYG48799.1 SRPBCC domain-containing protein [Gemmatimonadales bacterium]MYK01188.1 SRPBCC domain-containing protein [Candidatus Palauibacter ramosifaciens]